MTKAAFATALALAACAPLAGAQMPTKDNPECKERNPVFAKIANSFVTSCEHSRFSKLEIYQAKDPAKPAGEAAPVSKEGEYWSYHDQIVPDAQKRYPSRLEVFRNFENALKQGGGTVLSADDDRRFYYRIKRPSGEYWGIVGCGAGSREQCQAVSHKIVRPAAMEQSVVVSADEIKNSLSESGKVVFYGIYFDTDKAVIKPESAPTLAEMAKFLKANAAVKVFIVGHTDGQGALEPNLKLSKDRAAAVLAALAGSHAIARERMLAEGVGPLAPVAANDAEAGRARNQRVEMVLR
jgi:outer membrane protein OmpA-like peptidoglycan-associated protein